MYGFYSWQAYFLELLQRDLVWVNGVIATLVAVWTIAGNSIVGRLGKRGVLPWTILLVMVTVQAPAVVAAALLQIFWIAVPLYLPSTLAFGVMQPARQAWLNSRIPSEQRATVISLDARGLVGRGSPARGRPAARMAGRAGGDSSPGPLRQARR